MADPVQNTPLEKELDDFWQDFILPKDPWINIIDTLRETDYSNLKRKFDKYQENDALIQRLKDRDPPLLISVLKSGYGFRGRLEVLLESGKFDIDVPDSGGRTAFSHAAECHDATTMNLLLEHNANHTSKDENGWTPLMWVAKGMSQLNLSKPVENMIDFMCNKGADINCQDTNGQTALMLAAKAMRHGLIKILIDKKADGSKTDVEGHTWFWWLLKSRQQSEPERQGFQMLEKVDLSATDTDGRTLLSWAVEFQDIDMVGALLHRGADANKYDEGPPDPVLGVPFLRALESDNIDLASLFSYTKSSRSKIEDVQKDNRSLHILARNLYSVEEERALNLLRKMCKVSSYDMKQADCDGKTPLHHAIKRRKERFALGILQRLRGKDLDVMDNNSKTPLSYALENKMTNVVQQLVRNGAKIDLSLEWSQLGAGFIRFTLDSNNTDNTDNTDIEFINRITNEQDCIPSAGKTILCSYRKDNWPWLSMPSTTRQCRYLNSMKMESSQSGRTISQIVAFFPREENRHKLGDFWAIGCGTHAKQFGFATTIPSTAVPKSWKHLCEQFLDQLLQSWESHCDKESKKIEAIREKQLEKQGKSGRIIKDLAEMALNRAERRQCHQQHVSGLVEAFKNDASISSYYDYKDNLRPRVDQLKNSIGARLDQLEQASKELLQIEFAWVSISEAASIKRISLVTFIFLPLMFASSLFGMNVDILANNPDWRWYVVIGASSLILTLAIWIAFRSFPIEHWVDESRHWVYTFRRDIKKRWSRQQQKEPDAEMTDKELNV